MSVFTQTPVPRVRKNWFSLPHDHRTTFRMADLVPHAIWETNPGETFTIRQENLLRFTPLVSPVMHRIIVTSYWFYVPRRIVWDQFEEWITGDLDVLSPTIDYNVGPTNQQQSVYDYYGIQGNPLPAQATLTLDAMPFAAYNAIWNYWFRDQNLSTERTEECVAGDNNDTLRSEMQTLCKRSWAHDYFTSALPFAQKGDAVDLPLLEQNPSVEFQLPTNPVGGLLRDDQGDLITTGVDRDIILNAATDALEVGGYSDGAYYDPDGSLFVDIEEQAVTINTLRAALALQRFAEIDARGGTRYSEHIKSHFGVQTSDGRLQNPQLIGLHKQNMVISEVLSTAETIDSTDAITNPVGQMSGHGISAGGSPTYKFYSEEHGFIIGIINVQPVPSYGQGCHRMFTRTDRYDYYFPAFAHLGEQPILNQELYLDGSDVTKWGDTFGYIPRYSEFKYLNSKTTGEFTRTLKHWSMYNEFANTPTLNQTFIECNPREDIFAVTDEGDDHIIAHIIYDVKANRPMPIFGTPGII